MLRTAERAGCTRTQVPADVLASRSLSLGPIRSLSVIAVNALAPSLVGHIGPVVFVESGRILERAFIGIQDQAFPIFIHREGAPRNGEEFIAHMEKPTEGQHGVSDAPRFEIDHEVLNAAQVFVRAIFYGVAFDGAGRKNAPIALVRISLCNFCHSAAPRQMDSRAPGKVSARSTVGAGLAEE